MASLTVLRPGAKAIRHELDVQKGLTIGQGEENELALPGDPEIAPWHAELRLESGQWILVRRTIRNSLQMNGHTVGSPLPLRSGDEIAIGRTSLVFEDCGATVGSDPGAVRGDEWEGAPGRYVPSGESAIIRNFAEKLRRLAASDATVLLMGETGTGKEVAARAVHWYSGRRKAPFVVVNCPALPSSLVESELFGIERGVATGVDSRMGVLEAANHGTVFFDEVGDLDLCAQSKLLRFLQERTIDHIGGRRKVHVDVRIVAATHHDLEADVAAGAFRLDLYHRLKVLTLRVPPLRERAEDIPLLLSEFLSRGSDLMACIGPETLQALQAYRWPGNVRELQHLAKYLETVLDGGPILPEHLPFEIRCHGDSRPDCLHRRVIEEHGSFWDLVKGPFLRRELSRDEVRCFIARAYEEAGGSYLELARRMHMEEDHKKLLDFLRRHDLGVERRANRRAEPMVTVLAPDLPN